MPVREGQSINLWNKSEVVSPVWVEHTTYSLEESRSIQLSYGDNQLESYHEFYPLTSYVFLDSIKAI